MSVRESINTTRMRQRFLKSLRENCLVKEDDSLVVGVSGGQDSISLLDLLASIRQPLIAAVFNHHLRAEAAEEVCFVQSFCAERGITCVSGEGNVIAFAEENALSLEEAARILRYRFLFGTAETNQAAGVVAAHHANDQAETVLMHILRGSGLDGLSGMRPRTVPNSFSKTIPLVRPMLDIRRDEIETYISEHALPYRTDQTNFDPAYLRCKVRAQLIPEIEKEYSPRFIEQLCRLAENTARDNAYLTERTEEALSSSLISRNEDFLALDRRKFRSQSPAIQSRIVRETLSGFSKDDGTISALSVSEAAAFLNSEESYKVLDRGDGVEIRLRGDEAFIGLSESIPEWRFYPQLPGKIETCELGKAKFDVWEIAFQMFSCHERQKLLEAVRNDPYTAMLDADKLTSAPFYRRVIPGERFVPFGMKGSQKLSDFFVNQKIPREKRANFALLADTEGVLWVPGYRIARRAAVTTETKKIFFCRMIVL